MVDVVRIDGLKETVRSLERLGVSVADLKNAMESTGKQVVSDAQSLAPQRTGALAASIRQSKAKNKIDLRAGSAKTYYASFVEYGSIHNTAVGMLAQAASQNTESMIRAMESEIVQLTHKYNLD